MSAALAVAARVLDDEFTVTLCSGDTQPALFLAVTLYVPGARPLKTPIVFV